MRTLGTVCLTLATAVFFSSVASAGLIAVQGNCTKVIRDGGNGNQPKDGLGDSLGSHNSGMPTSGFRNVRENSIAMYVFELPELNGATIYHAQLNSFLGLNTASGFNIDAVAVRTDPSDFHLQFSDYETAVGLLGSSQMIYDDLATPSSPAGNAPLPSISDGNLLTYLNSSAYVDNGYLFIAMVPDTLPSTNTLVGKYGVNAFSPLNTDAPMTLWLDINPIPEPASFILAALAAGMVLVVRRRR